MGKTVIFTPEAREHLVAIADYLEEHFSQTAAEHFVKAVETAIEKIATYPVVYPITASDPDVHFFRMDQHRRIFYEDTADAIWILAIFDTRQDPSKSPY